MTQAQLINAALANGYEYDYVCNADVRSFEESQNSEELTPDHVVIFKSGSFVNECFAVCGSQVVYSHTFNYKTKERFYNAVRATHLKLELGLN